MKRTKFETEMRERVEQELLYLLKNARNRSAENENHPDTDGLTQAFHPRYRAALDLLADAIENGGLLEQLVAEQTGAAEQADFERRVEAEREHIMNQLASTPLAQAFGVIPLPRDGEQADGGERP